MPLQQPPCPCGSGASYDACCGRLHRGAAQAATAEELMRSRYAAYAVGDLAYVERTWHPRTRPVLSPTRGLAWTGLEIHRAEGDVVEFTATYDGPRGRGGLHETSRFERRAGRWMYVHGVGEAAPTGEESGAD